jgi:hypothetical protein
MMLSRADIYHEIDEFYRYMTRCRSGDHCMHVASYHFNQFKKRYDKEKTITIRSIFNINVLRELIF